MADTIAAIATGGGRSAIGILRLSGEHACEVLRTVFRPVGKTPLLERPCGTLIYGSFYDGEGQLLDNCLATFSKAPHSYTGEDTAELQCHGSPAVLQTGLEALFHAGARQASPGEFTKRAFLNGKLDLVQAEAVIDLIDAETPAAARHAAGQLSGAVSEKINAIYDKLVDLMAHFCAVLDYPDEDIDAFEASEIARYAAQASTDLRTLAESYHRGRQLTEGVATAIIGSPNAGKSSLLNALLGYDRAIVTPIPGTTRDTVEEKATLGGVLLRLIDTAGLRDTEDTVERIGVQRSRDAIAHAELALIVLDAAQPLSEEDREAVLLGSGADHALLLLNKSDLPPVLTPDITPDIPAISISTKTGEGLSALEQHIADLFPAGRERPGALLTNARQADAVRRGSEALCGIGDALSCGMPPDAVLSDVEVALAALGEVTGRSVSEDITGRIFARFCVGK